MAAERQVRFAFRSGHSGSAPATWGQRAIWDAVAALAPEDAARYTVRGGGAVAPGYSVEDITRALSGLVVRHESLRTRLVGDEDGGLRQNLLGTGEQHAAVLECAPDDVPAEAAALLDRLAGQPFDTAQESPIRVGIVESEGSARHVVLAVAHTAVDGWGLRHLVTDLAELTAGATTATDTATDRLQPLAEAAFQASPRGSRQDAAARKYWSGKVEHGPRQLLAPVADDPADRLFPNALLDSPALGRALPALAERLSVSPAAVLLAASAAMVARLGGSAEALFQVVVNNRFLPGLERAVSTVAQEGLFALTVADVPFDELVRRAFGASLAAYRHAYYDKAALDRDLAGLQGADTGAADLTCFVNDTRGLMPSPAAPDADDAKASEPLEELRCRTTLTWPVEFPPRPKVSFALDAVDLPGSLGLTMTADPARLPRPDMERFLVGIEDLVVEEALRSAAR